MVVRAAQFLVRALYHSVSLLFVVICTSGMAWVEMKAFITLLVSTFDFELDGFTEETWRPVIGRSFGEPYPFLANGGLTSVRDIDK